MPRLTNMQKRVLELEDALSMFLECEGSPDPNEMRVAREHARKVLRNKVIPHWKKAPPIEHYNLEKQFNEDMAPEYIGEDG